MKIRISAYLILFLVTATTQATYAQVNASNYFIPAPFPKAPNTAAMEKYGSYEVNLFTGVPNISIPLYNIESGGLSVPVTLSYHASGIKVAEVASWVGLGWSLSAGGTISRRIMGGADEGVGGYLQGWLRSATSFSTTNNADIDELDRLVTRTHDAQPDIFSYDFSGHSGKFFFNGNENNKPALIPFSAISIANTNYSGSHSLDPLVPKFAIKDEHGNVYSFGYNERETTGTTTQSTPAVYYTSAWMLEKMISQNRKDTISFNYSNQTVRSPDMTSETYIINDNINQSPANYSYFSGTGLSNPNSATINEKLLSEIYYKNGKVVFEKDPALRSDIPQSNINALKRLKVYKFNFSTKAYELQKTIVFYTGSFDPKDAGGTRRLKLDSIQILDKAGAVQQRYKFDYNATPNLPSYGSKMIDYWGYYNGKDNNKLIPKMTVPYTQGGTTTNVIIGSNADNSRESDSTYMQANVLKRIYYPTGGYTDFTYQTNQYDEVGVLKLAGGLRVSSIKSYDGVNAAPIVRSYVYNTARKNFILDFGFFSTIQTHQYWSFNAQGGTGIALSGTMTSRTFVANSKVDLEPFDASIVVYPSVSEYSGTPGTNSGRTDYLFRDLSDIFSSASMTGTPVIKSYFFARGQLIRKSQYLKKSDGSYQIVQMDSTSYTAFPTKTYTAVGLVAGRSVVNDGQRSILYYPESPNPIGTNGFSFQNYDLISEDNYATGTLSRSYELSDPSRFATLTTELKYGNDKHQQVTRTRYTDSKGDTRVSVNKYPADYAAGNLVLDSMLNRNMQAEVIERWDSIKTVSPVLNAVVKAQLNRFKPGSIAGTIVPANVSTLSVLTPITNFTPSEVNLSSLVADSRYEQMVSFDLYDQKNNIRQYSPRNGTPSVIFWDYNFAQPVAQVKNADLVSGLSAAYTSFEADQKGNWTFAGTPVTDNSSPTGVMSYSLSSGPVTSPAMTNAKSYVLSLWAKGAAPMVAFASANRSAIALKTFNGWTNYEYKFPAASSQAVISGSVQIDELRLFPADAQMSSYAYDPFGGQTAVTDAKGMVTNYEYDNFQRLMNIKDQERNIVKNYQYNYASQQTVVTPPVTTYLSATRSGSFTRDNCGTCMTGSTVTYSVDAGTYTSTVSQAAADQQAQDDVTANGQAYANTNGTCPPVTSVYFSNTTGSGYYAYVSSGTWSCTYNFPTNGALTLPVPSGTYTIDIIPTGTSVVHRITLGTRATVVAPRATFTQVNISSGSSDLSITVAP